MSGFLDRCLWVVDTYGITKECLGNITDQFTFTNFVDRIINMSNYKQYITNPHYWPQSWFCRLNEFINEYDYVIKYDYHNIGHETLKILELLNLSEYYYHWGEYFNETMFKDSVHVTYKGGDELQSKIEFYSKYYTLELAVKCIKLFQDDYRLFDMSYPEWIYHL